MTAASEEEKERLEHGEVGAADGVGGELAQAGPGKNSLDGDRAREDEAEVDRSEGHDREQRVGNGMAVAHRHIPQSLGPSHREIVLTHYVEQRAPGDEGVLPEIGQGEGQRGKEHVVGLVDEQR